MNKKITYNLVATKQHTEAGIKWFNKGGVVVKGVNENKARRIMEDGFRFVVAHGCYGKVPAKNMKVVQVTTITKQTTKTIKF